VQSITGIAFAEPLKETLLRQHVERTIKQLLLDDVNLPLDRAVESEELHSQPMIVDVRDLVLVVLTRCPLNLVR
jgi:hypothetical protein